MKLRVYLCEYNHLILINILYDKLAFVFGAMKT